MSHPSYPWFVVHDPQKIYTGPFNKLALRLTAEAGYWPEGIIFQHKFTQERLIFVGGRLVEVGTQETTHDTHH